MMRIKFNIGKRQIATALSGVLTATLLVAVPFSAFADTWEYYTEIIVQDTGGVLRAGVPVLIDIGGDNLVDAGVVTANATDSRLNEGNTEHNCMIESSKVGLFIPSLGATQQRTYRLYYAYLPYRDGFEIITGTGGYVTIADHADIELADNFTVTQNAWIDTSASAVSANLVAKANSFRTFVSAVGEITSNITVSGITTLDLSIEADEDDCVRSHDTTDYWQLADYSSAGGLGGTNDQYGSGLRFIGVTIPQGTTITTAYITFTAGLSTAGTSVNTTFSAEDVDNAIAFADNKTTFDTRFANNTASTVNWDNLPAWTATNEYQGTEIKTVIQEIVDRPGWVSGNAIVIFWEDFAGRSTSAVACRRAAESYNYSPPEVPVLHIEAGGTVVHTATATGISSGFHTIATTCNVTSLAIHVDRVESANTTGGSAANNANIWATMRGACMPYTDNMTISVNGTQKLWLEPIALIDSLTIPDRAGANNDGTIHYGTNSNLTVTIGGTTSDTDTTSDAGTTDAVADTVLEAEMPTMWYGTGANIAALPFYSTFNGTATDIGMTTQTLYVFSMLGVASAIGLSALLFSGSVLIAIMAAAVLIGLGVSTTILGGWMIFTFLLLGLALLFLSRR